MRARWCTVMATAVLLVSTCIAHAIPLPSTEQIEQYKLEGRWGQVEDTITSLHEKYDRIIVGEADLLSRIGRDYGLPTSSADPAQPAGSLSANLDGNDVVDERDVLELGFQPSERGTSTTLPYGTVAANNQPKVLVVLIKFTDKEPTDLSNQGSLVDVNHNTAWAEDKFLDLSDPPGGDLEKASMAYYYKQTSYGKLELGGDVFFEDAICDGDGWITCPAGTATYAQLAGGDRTALQVTDNAISQLDPYVDFTDYDSNGDGYVDGLVTIYAGADDLTDPDSELWYFRWWQQPGFTTSDGVRVGSATWASEEGYLYLYSHEFGHELGLPDLYDVGGDDTGPIMPGAGYWSLMADWNNAMGRKPPFHDAFCRAHMKWVEPVDLPTTATATALTVNRATSTDPADTVHRIWRNGRWGQEYFLVEFRDVDHGFDESLPGDDGGLLIWHVDEGRTSSNNLDNAFDPQRLWIETADNDTPDSNLNLWESGYLGADTEDFFNDSTVPNAADNDGFGSRVLIDPTSDSSGSFMTFDAKNEAPSGLPTLSWDSPASGATVSGDVTIDVTSNAVVRVEYYVNDCLKRVESQPAPYDGFTWDTTTAFNGDAELRAVAYNSTGNDPVRVIYRTVTVDNPQLSGLTPTFSDNFNSYSSDQDSALLDLWNIREDNMGSDIVLETGKRYQGTGASIAFRQSGNFGAPPMYPDPDPNAGIYQGQTNDWLMTPRINLDGYGNIALSYRAAFGGTGFGEQIVQAQVTTDDGATWTDLDGMTPSALTGDYNTGDWDTNSWALRSFDLNAFGGEQIYLRFLFVGGAGYQTRLGIDEFSLSGQPFVLSSVSPTRIAIGATLTLNGNGFSGSQGTGTVRFYDGAGGFVEQATVLTWGNTQITCAVPAGAKSHATAAVWVLKDGNETNKKGLSIPLAAPVLTGVGQR